MTVRMSPYRNVHDVSANDEVAPIIPATITEEPWSPHSYTNVAFAQATAHGQYPGQHSASKKHGKSKKSRM